MPEFRPILHVLHPEHAAGPHWRRCRLAITLDAARQRVHVSAAIRQDRNGAEVSDLHESMPFIACLDHLVEDMMRAAFPDIAGIGYRLTPLLRASSRCFSATRGSPVLSFMLGDPAGPRLLGATAHDMIALHAAVDRIAAREAARRKTDIRRKAA